MGPSATDVPAAAPAGKKIAVIAESLFLANLALMPGIAFIVIAWLWLKHRHAAPPLARNHLNQSFHVSLRGGILLILASTLVIVLGGLDSAWTWVVVIVYFTCIHSMLIVFGCLALARAMAGRHYEFPVLGVRDE